MKTPLPPLAARIPFMRRHHDDVYQDDLNWLRNRTDSKVLAHLEAENSYARAITQPQEALRHAIFEEIRARAGEADLSVPSRRGDWWYYARIINGQQYPVHCRIPVIDHGEWTPPKISTSFHLEREQVLLNCNEQVDEDGFFSLGSAVVSDDGHFLAYCVDTRGDEFFNLRIKNLRQNETLTDRIERVSRHVAWAPGGTHFYYIRLDDSWRPYELRMHIMGTDAATDAVIYHESSSQMRLAFSRSADHAELVISSGNSSHSETLLVDLIGPASDPRLLISRTLGIAHAVEPVTIQGERRYLIRHNHDAPNNMVSFAKLAQLGPSTDPRAWQTVIPHQENVRIGGVAVTKTHMLLTVRKAMTRRVLVCPWDDLTTPREPTYQEDLTTVRLLEAEFDAPVIRLAYTSFLSPARIYEYVLSTDKLLLRKQISTGPDYRTTSYTTSREWATSDDNTPIPVTLLRRNDLKPDGSNPCLMFGYGAYGASQDPVFFSPWVSLLDRGIIIAIAHVRGGGELGSHWHEAGKTQQKKNSFTDFLAATQHMVDSGWADPKRVAAMGGSAGGLLVGAAFNLAPHLYRTCVLQVPFLDPLTSLLDPTYPLSAQDWNEWGNPRDDPSAYWYIKSYSPYENLRPQPYPRTLVRASYHDTRVMYAEAAKWVQRAREIAQGGEPILLITAMTSGHQGKSGRHESWREHALYCAFVADALGTWDRAKSIFQPTAGART